MRLISRFLALVLLAGIASAQPTLMNCATGVACGPSGPVGSNTGDPLNVAGYKFNTDVTELWNTLFAPITGDVNINSGTNHSAIQPNVVVNADMAPMAAATTKCNLLGTTANPTDCTGTQLGSLLGISGISGLYGYQQLSQQYTTGITGYPTIGTTDVGPVFWNGAVWAPLSPWNVARSAVPMGIPPNGTVAANGVVTLGTALDRIYPSIYLRFPAGALFTNSPSGVYYASCSSTTICTVFNNVYALGTPQIPVSPVAIVSASVGAYTQAACGSPCEILLLTGTLPANVIGPNGEVDYSWTWNSNNSASAKVLGTFISGHGVGGATNAEVNQDSQTTAGTARGSNGTSLRFQGSVSSAIATQNGQGDAGSGTSFVVLTQPTTVQQQVSFRAWLTSATDWLILQTGSIDAKSSLLADNPVYVPLPASAAIVPAPAKALGYNTNSFFFRPSTSDISFSNTPSSALYASLWFFGSFNSPSLYSMTATPWTPSGQVLTIAGGTGGNTFGAIATQRANSTAGTLPYQTAATGFYCEWQWWLSDNNPDHWAAAWMEPQEHTTNPATDTMAGQVSTYEGWVEIDTSETGVSGSIYGSPYRGPLQTAINWSGFFSHAFTLTAAPATLATAGTLSGAGWTGPLNTSQQAVTSTGQALTVTIGASPTAITWTPGITGTPTATLTFKYTGPQHHDQTLAPSDWTVPNTDGVSYNPSTKTISFYHNGVLQDAYSTASYDSSINPYHYYLIVNASGLAQQVPYNMYLGYEGCWHP